MNDFTLPPAFTTVICDPHVAVKIFIDHGKIALALNVEKGLDEFLIDTRVVVTRFKHLTDEQYDALKMVEDFHEWKRFSLKHAILKRIYNARKFKHIVPSPSFTGMYAHMLLRRILGMYSRGGHDISDESLYTLLSSFEARSCEKVLCFPNAEEDLNEMLVWYVERAKTLTLQVEGRLRYADPVYRVRDDFVQAQAGIKEASFIDMFLHHIRTFVSSILTQICDIGFQGFDLVIIVLAYIYVGGLLKKNLATVVSASVLYILGYKIMQIVLDEGAKRYKRKNKYWVVEAREVMDEVYHIFFDTGDGIGHRFTVPIPKGPEQIDNDHGLRVEEVESQGLVGPAIGAAVVGIFARRLPVYRLVTDSTKLMAGIDMISTGCIANLESVLNFFCRLAGKEHHFSFGVSRAVKIWYKSVGDFQVRFSHGNEACTDVAMRGSFRSLVNCGLNLRTNTKCSKELALITKGLEVLDKLGKSFPQISANARMEPIVVMLRGEPGVGKTMLMRFISEFIYKRLLTLEVKNAFGSSAACMYQKGTSKYWEQYGGQPILVMDDWGQAIQKAGEEDNEMATFIRVVNQWPFPLNMAFENKGKVLFNSDFVLMTTNLSNSSYIRTLVNSAAAVSRRFDIAVHVEKDPDMSLKSIVNCHDADKCWTFYDHDFNEGHTSRNGFNLRQLFAKIEGIYREKQGFGSHLNSVVAPIIDSYFPEDDVIADEDIAPQGALLNVCVAGAAVYVGSRVVRRVKGVVNNVKKAIGFVDVAAKLTAVVTGVILAAKFLGSAIKTIVRFLFPPKIESQAQPQDEVALKISNNIIPFHPINGVKLGNLLCIDENNVLFPYHFVVGARAKGVDLSFSHKGERIILNTVGVGPLLGDKDACIVHLGKPLQGIRDIKHMFVTHSSYRNSAPVIYLGDMKSFFSHGVEEERFVKYTDATYTARSRVIPYDAPTKVGDCGGAVISAKINITNRLYGIHVAGDGCGKAYYCPVTQEDFAFIRPQSGSITVVDSVKPMHNPGQTKFVPTSFAGVLAPTAYRPAFLRPALDAANVLVDPMKKAIADTNVDFGEISPPSSFVEASKFVIGDIMRHLDKRVIQKLDYVSQVGGFDHPYGRGINRGTSPGYPYCLEYSNKRPIYGEKDWVFDTPAAMQVEKDVAALEHRYANGLLEPRVLFRDVLKDELLGKSKIDTVTTRLIATSPLHYSLLIRKYTLGFVAEFMRHRMKHGCLIGVNPYSEEWGIVHSKLSRFDTAIYDGDFKQFDKRQHPAVLKCICDDLADALYIDEVDRKILKGAFQEVYMSSHIGGDAYKSSEVYQKVGSLPSGHPLTSILNSIYNKVIFISGWIDAFGVASLLDLESNLTLFVYGDDNIFSTSKKFQSFDFNHMVGVANGFGMKYVVATKDGEAGDVQFLKRNFVLRDGYCYAALNVDSIEDMLNWRKRTTSEDEHLQSVIPCVMREAVAHGFDYFQSVVIRLFDYFGSSLHVHTKFGLDEIDNGYYLWQAAFRGFVPVWTSEFDSDFEARFLAESGAAGGSGEPIGHDRQVIFSQSGFSHKNLTKMDNTQTFNNKTNLIGTGTLEPDGSRQDDGHTSLVAVSHDMAYLTTSDNSHGLEVYRPPPRLFDRPVLFAAGSFTNGAVGTTLISSFSEADVILSENINNAAGFVGIRFCMKFTLVVSAPPQSAGIIKLVLYPYTDADQSDGLTKSTYAPLWSQAPNAELNLADTNSVELCYDFKFHRQYVRLGTIQPDPYLLVVVGAYTPVTAPLTATSPITYSLYVSYTDVELIGPGSGLNTVIAQSGLEFKAVGPISTIMQYTSKIANGISDRIPILSKYLNPVSWIASGVGSLAAQFGYSRPNRSANKLIQSTFGRTYNTALTITNAAEFGMIDNNQVAVIDDIGFNNVDEMSFDFLTSVPGCIFRGNLSVSDTPLSYKWACSVNPSYFVFQTQGSAASYTQVAAGTVTSGASNVSVLPTPIFMISQCMKYWRGDLTFRFKFARSKFMGGRVLLGYNPKPDSQDGEVVGATVRYEYPSIVVDLREGSVFDLEVPYNHPDEMLSNIPYGYPVNNGVVFMRVIDPLLVASDVTSTCYFIVEVFSKKGIMFGAPSRCTYGYGPQNTTIYAQSGLSTFERVIGEPVLSTKQLISRPSWNHVPNANSATWFKLAIGTPLTINSTSTYMDFLFTSMWNSPGNTAPGTMSFLNLFLPAYRFWRGSFIFNYLPAVGETVNIFGANATETAQGVPMVREQSVLASARYPYYSAYTKSPTIGSLLHPDSLTILTSTTPAAGYYSLVPGDDFQMGAFTGFGPVAQYNSAILATMLW
jgi:hypothetical protein